MASYEGFAMLNDSDSEELKRSKINSNFQLLLSSLTSGLGNGSAGTIMVFGGNGIGGSQYGYYNAVRDRLEIDRLFAEDLEAKYARFDFANIGEAAISKLTADQAFISNLSASFAKIDFANIGDAAINRLASDEGFINILSSTFATITNLNAVNANVTALSAKTSQLETAIIGKADIDFANIEDAAVDNLVAKEAFFTALDARYALVSVLKSEYATIALLDSEIAEVDEAIFKKADIDFLNVDASTVDREFVRELMVQSGFVANEGTVYSLTALEINAGDIKSGTLTVDRLIVQNQTDHEYYMLGPDEHGEIVQTKLEGSTIKRESIDADRIIANSITTSQITTNNLIGTGGWINLASGTFMYGTLPTDPEEEGDEPVYNGNYISWDGSDLVIDADRLSISSVDVNGSITTINQRADKIEFNVAGVKDDIDTINDEKAGLSDLTILRNQIIGSVVSDDGSSLFTMNEDGSFTWDASSFVGDFDLNDNGTYSSKMAELNEGIADADERIGDLSESLDDSVSGLSDRAASVEAKTQGMMFTGDGLFLSDQPLTDGELPPNYIRIYGGSSGQGIEFYNGGSSPVAYMVNDMLYIENEQIVDTLRFGHFKFFERHGTSYISSDPNLHNMGLKWVE